LINLAQLDLPFFLSEGEEKQFRSFTLTRYQHNVLHTEQHNAALNTILPLLEHRQEPGDGHIEDTFDFLTSNDTEG